MRNIVLNVTNQIFKERMYTMLKKENTVLLLIDIQGNLAHSMYEKELLFENLQKLIQGITILKIPILWVEQYPQGLGPTIAEIAHLLPNLQPLSKTSFSSCGNELFLKALNASGCQQVLVGGIETHVCVYQTVADLLELGYEVQVVKEAVSSRTAGNKDIGLQKMRDSGATFTSVETALFELLKVAEGDEFKEILAIVK